MATAAKKTVPPGRPPTDRPRKRAVTPDIEMPEIDVLELSSADAAEQEPDLVVVFRLDGKPYHVDRNRGVGVAMRMMKTLSTRSEEEAIGGMLLELLGEEAFDALANFPGVTSRHLAQVLLSCNKAVLGDAESGPKA